MTSERLPRSETDIMVERGETYQHEEHGRVEVNGIWRGVTRVDEARHMDETSVIIVRFSAKQGGISVDLTDTLDAFIEAIKSVS